MKLKICLNKHCLLLWVNKIKVRFNMAMTALEIEELILKTFPDAKITIDDDIKLLEEGESTFVPLGSVHRLENPGKEPIMLIEVQIGSYLGEDDIIRYEDNYSRK